MGWGARKGGASQENWGGGRGERRSRVGGWGFQKGGIGVCSVGEGWIWDQGLPRGHLVEPRVATEGGAGAQRWDGGTDPRRRVPGARRGEGVAVTEGSVGAQLAVVALEALARAPAIVATALHQVHLLELVLAHVTAEETPAARARRRVATVERASPHVAHPQGVDLGSRGGVTHERVVGRDPVERAALVAVHVDAQHLAQQRRPAGGWVGHGACSESPCARALWHGGAGTGAGTEARGPRPSQKQGKPGLWGQTHFTDGAAELRKVT